MENIKKRIAFNKFWDYAFWVTGLLSTFVGLFLLFALMIDLMIDGLPRLSYNFLHPFHQGFLTRQAYSLHGWGAFLCSS